MSENHKTIYTQYNRNVSNIATLVNYYHESLDLTADFDGFYDNFFNIDTATGYWLDVWGRIVGIDRYITVLSGQFFGFDEATDALPFNQGVFYNGNPAASTITLNDTDFRRVIKAKAMVNISSNSIPDINAILAFFYDGRGVAWATDGSIIVSPDPLCGQLFLRPTTIIEQSGWYYVGLQSNPDTGFRHGGFIAVNKTTGEQVDYSTFGETNALLYAGGNIYYCSGDNGSTGMDGIFKVPLNGDAETRVVPSSSGRGYVGLAYDGTNLWTIELFYYGGTANTGQHIVKLDTDLNVISSQRIDTVAGTQSRYPEGKNIYIDNGEVWAVVADASGVYKATLDNASFTKIACYATHLAFTDTHVFASGGNSVKKINRSTLAIDATYTLTGCRHILYVAALDKLAVSTGNTITYLLTDGTVDSVVSVHADARQSLWSDGRLLTCSYADDMVTNLCLGVDVISVEGFLIKYHHDFALEPWEQALYKSKKLFPHPAGATLVLIHTG